MGRLCSVTVSSSRTSSLLFYDWFLKDNNGIHQGLFARPLGVIDRLCSVNVAPPRHLLFVDVIRR